MSQSPLGNIVVFCLLLSIVSQIYDTNVEIKNQTVEIRH